MKHINIIGEIGINHNGSVELCKELMLISIKENSSILATNSFRYIINIRYYYIIITISSSVICFSCY